MRALAMRSRGRAAVVIALLILQGCASAKGGTGGAGGTPDLCGAAADAPTRRTVDVYAATLRHLLERRDAGQPVPKVLYVLDRAVVDPSRADLGGTPFTPSVRRCLAKIQLPGRPSIRFVTGFDDPTIRHLPSGGPIPRIADGRLVNLTAVPVGGDGVTVGASSNGGGGFHFYGGTYVVERRGGSWRVVAEQQTFIA